MKYPKDAKRIKEVCDYLHITSYTLAKNLGYKSPSSIYHIEKGLSRITTSMATKITGIYPQLNFVYLLGEGDEEGLILSKEMQAQQFHLSTSSRCNESLNEDYLDLKRDLEMLNQKIQVSQQQLQMLQKDMRKVLQILLKNNL